MSISSPPVNIKVGFVGLSTTGWAARTLAPSLFQPSLGGAYDIVAISTTSEASAQISADKYSKEIGHPIKAYFGDTSRIASDPDVDLVVVAVKAPYHKQVILPVIEAKKDFFLEWPAGVSLNETEEIAAAARKQGVRSIVGLQGRHSAVMRKVKELLSSDAIGTVRSTNIRMYLYLWDGVLLAHIPRESHALWTPYTQEQYLHLAQKRNGSTLLDIPIAHFLDTLTYVLGDFVTVSAADATFYPLGTIVDPEGKPAGKTYPVETPDHFAITGALKGGVLANVFWRGGYASSKGRRHFIWEIDGDDGSIRMELGAPFPTMLEPDLYLNGEKIEFETPGNPMESLGIAWKAFANHDHANHATIEDAVKNRRLLDAIERSAKSGQRITF